MWRDDRWAKNFECLKINCLFDFNVQGSGRDGAPAATATDVDEGDSILDSVSDSFSELSDSVSDFVSENLPGIVHSFI